MAESHGILSTEDLLPHYMAMLANIPLLVGKLLIGGDVLLEVKVNCQLISLMTIIMNSIFFIMLLFFAYLYLLELQ